MAFEVYRKRNCDTNINELITIDNLDKEVWITAHDGFEFVQLDYTMAIPRDKSFKISLFDSGTMNEDKTQWNGTYQDIVNTFKEQHSYMNQYFDKYSSQFTSQNITFDASRVLKVDITNVENATTNIIQNVQTHNLNTECYIRANDGYILKTAVFTFTGARDGSVNDVDLLSIGTLNEEQNYWTATYDDILQAGIKVNPYVGSALRNYKIQRLKVTTEEDSGSTPAPEPEIPEPEVKKFILDMQNATIDDDTVEPSWVGKRVITADEGYELSLIQFGVHDVDRPFYYTLTGVPEFETMFNSDRTVFTLDLNTVANYKGLRPDIMGRYENFYIKVIAIEKVEVPDISTGSIEYIKNYVMDSHELNVLANTYYMFLVPQLPQAEMNNGLIAFNLMTKVIHIPYKIPLELVPDTKRDIYFGQWNSKLKGNILSSNTLIYDYGTIDIPETYSNANDYKNTIITVFLPFIEPFNIEPVNIIGGSLNAKLIIDLYTGKGTIIVTSSKIGNNIVKKEVRMVCREIPTISFVDTVQGTSVGEHNYNLDHKFKVMISRNKVLENRSNSKDNQVYDTVGNYTGHIKVDDLEIESSATYYEISEIKSMLQNGIIIDKKD